MNFDTSAKRTYVSADLRADESFGTAGFKGNAGKKHLAHEVHRL